MTLEEKEYAFMDAIDNGFALKESEMTLEEKAEEFMKDKDFDLSEGYSLAFIEVALEQFAEQELKQAKSLLSKCYDRFFSSCLKTCDDDLIELKKQIQEFIKE